MKAPILQNYTPTNSEARWLRMWTETGRPLTGANSVKNSADFAAMQRENIKAFREWANTLAALLGGDDQQKAKRKKRYNVEGISENEAVDLAEDFTIDEMVKASQDEN